jgi:signal transduction histidine kinase
MMNDIKYNFHVKIEGLISKISTKLINVDNKEIERIINQVLKEIGEVLEADRVYVFEFNEIESVMNNTYEWCKEGISCEKDNLQGLDYNIFPWWMGEILNKQMIYIEDTHNMPEEAKNEQEILLAQNIKSLLVLPIVVANRSIGFFGVDNVLKTDLWTENDQALLKIISSILSDFFSEIAYRQQLLKKNEYLDQSFNELKRLQSQIIQKEKMSAIGQLSSGLAHEINNKIATIKSNVEILDEYYTSTIKAVLIEYNIDHKNEDVDYMINEIDPIFDDIRNDFNKVKRIIDSIRKLTDAPKNLMGRHNINDIVKDVLSIYKSEPYDELKLILQLEHVRDIYCIRTEVSDVINSILKNSVEAFKKNFVLDSMIKIQTYIQEDYCIVEIIDNAGGIKDDVIDKVFEPFFSTKAIGESYGLGLSQAYDVIVNRHNGKISIKNIEQNQLCIKLELPINQKL